MAEPISLEKTTKSPLLTPAEMPIDQSTENKTDLVAKDIFLKQNPTLEGMNAALRYEEVTTNKVRGMQENAEKLSQTIDLLLDLSKELSNSSGDTIQTSEKAKDLFNQLKDKGIHLVTDVKESYSKEDAGILKSAISAHIDQSRTKVQQIFTKMQTEIQNMSSVNDTVKRILSETSDLLRKIQERTGRR